MALNINEKIEIRATFMRDGELASPTPPVYFDIIRPDGTQETPILGTLETAGIYKCEYTPPEAGRYSYRARSADGGRENSTFNVLKEAFA